MKLLDSHNRNGINREFFVDGDNLIVKTSQHVQPLLTACEKYRLNEDKSLRRKSEFWHVAEIPPIAIYEANKKYGCDVMARENRALLKRLLNTDWSGFKTKELNI